MGMKSIPDGVNSPAIAKHMEQCCAELIEAVKRGIYNDVVQMAKPEAIKLAPSSKRSILISDFTLSMKGVPSISKVCLMGSRGQFLKIRCTYPVDRKEEAEKAFSKLLEDLAVVIDAQQA